MTYWLLRAHHENIISPDTINMKVDEMVSRQIQSHSISCRLDQYELKVDLISTDPIELPLIPGVNHAHITCSYLDLSRGHFLGRMTRLAHTHMLSWSFNQQSKQQNK